MSRVHSRDALIRTELVERLEVAEAGGRELDDAVLLNTSHPFGFDWPDDSERSPVTTSLDASLGLAEKMLPGWQWLVRGPDKDGRDPLKCFARVASPDYDSVTWEAGDRWTTDHLAGRDAIGRAATPALALCIAVLKATTASSVGTSAASEPNPTPTGSKP